MTHCVQAHAEFRCKFLNNVFREELDMGTASGCTYLYSEWPPVGTGDRKTLDERKYYGTRRGDFSSGLFEACFGAVSASRLLYAKWVRMTYCSARVDTNIAGSCSAPLRHGPTAFLRRILPMLSPLLIYGPAVSGLEKKDSYIYICVRNKEYRRRLRGWPPLIKTPPKTAATLFCV